MHCEDEDGVAGADAVVDVVDAVDAVIGMNTIRDDSGTRRRRWLSMGALIA
jgi:hypothetical protein